MFGSLILPTTTTTTGAGAAALTGTRITSRSFGGGGGGIQSSPNLSSMGSIPNYYYYHPTMSFPSHPKLPPRTRGRIRASFTTAPAPAPDTNTNTNTTTPLNLYQILRIKQNASSLEIKTAYRKLAKQFHPDALPPPPPTTSSSSDYAGGARDFMAIHNAYATLSDPTERARYDLSIDQIHNTRRFHRYYSTSTSTSTAVDGNQDRWRRKRSYGMQTTRRWETDQCW